MSKSAEAFEHVRKMDMEGFTTHERFSQHLVAIADNLNCKVTLSKAPPGASSSHGLHTHEGEQMFYVLKGNLCIEIDHETFEVDAGSLVICPAGALHRWTSGAQGSSHLEFTCLPPSNKKSSTG